MTKLESILLASLFFLSACTAPKPQKGGHARASVTPTNMLTEAVQPENPAAPASQSAEWVDETFFTIPAGSEVFKRTTIPSTNAEVAPQRIEEGFTVSEPVPVKKTFQRRSQATIGASQKDEGRLLGVKMNALKPIMLAGVACLFAAGALAYFGQYIGAAIAGVTGITMLVLFVTLPQYGIYIMGIGLGAGALVLALVFLAYHKGNHHVLQDVLDKVGNIGLGKQ